MRTHIVRIVVGALVLALIGSSPRAEAQTQDRAAAYWQAYAEEMPPNSTLKLRLSDGSRVRGRLLGILADDIVIRRDRAFRRDIEQRVPFAEITDLKRTHPTRDSVITAAVGVGGLYLLILVWANHAFQN